MREQKALAAANLEKSIEKELLERLHSQTYDNIYNFPLAQYQNALNEMEVLSDSEAAPAAPDVEEPEEEFSAADDLEQFVEAYSSDEDDGDDDSAESDAGSDDDEEAGPASEESDGGNDKVRRLAAAAAAAAASRKRSAPSKPAPKRTAKPARAGGKRTRMEIEYEEETTAQRH